MTLFFVLFKSYLLGICTVAQPGDLHLLGMSTNMACCV